MRRYILMTVLALGWAMNLFPCYEVEIETVYSSNNLFCEAVPNDDDYDYLIESTECRDFQFFVNHYCFGCYKEWPNYGNMEEWAKYLKIDVDQAYYLVNKVSQQTIDSLLIYGASGDPQLKFADKAFCKKWSAALNYISFAKYLEPYMGWIDGENTYSLWHYPYETRWGYGRGKTNIFQLDYTEVMNTMVEAYGRQKDKELKLRYGFQMVRFAHYYAQYEDAIKYFDKYVEPLNYKPEIYYYALSQKAGALHGLQKTDGEETDVHTQANSQYAKDFLKVFAYSKDMKFAAYKSLRDGAWEILHKSSKSLSEKEACCFYFMLGFNSFNNGLKELEKIAAISPNSYMADVLMSGYITSLPISVWSTGGLKNANLEYALGLAETMLQKSSHQDFWHLCVAHLSAYNGKNDQAKLHLSKVKSNRPCFKANKDKLSAYMAINEAEEMSRETANDIYKKYANVLDDPFLRQIMANRMDNDMEVQWKLLSFDWLNGFSSGVWEDAIALGNDPKINDFEKWLLKNNNYSLDSARGELSRSYLYEGNIPKALEYAKYYKSNDLSLKSVFCYNIDRNIWSSPEEENDFNSDYIKKMIDKKLNLSNISYADLLKQLDALYKTALQDNAEGAKAAFLLGNFYFNISPRGYYRSQIFKYNPSDASDMENYTYNTDRHFFEMADGKAFTDDELKAKIIFSLAKVGNENHGKPGDNYRRLTSGYKRTKAYKTFVSKCSYFSKFVND